MPSETDYIGVGVGRFYCTNALAKKMLLVIAVYVV